MKFLIVSAANLTERNDSFLGYGPYIKEMEIWARHADEIGFACPIEAHTGDKLLQTIEFKIAKVFKLDAFNIKSVKSAARTIPAFFHNIQMLITAMRWADHIHLRCPGNIGLLGCTVQIFFPNKTKTAKYAGNWDPASKQPLSYRLQKWILSNTFLTKKIQVLVYGEWSESSSNIKAFFTATYSEGDKLEVPEKSLDATIKFVYAGTLSPGKQPLYAIKLIQKIANAHPNLQFSLFGEGSEREALERYIADNNLGDYVKLFGNQSAHIIKQAFIDGHFLLLPSRSEGWPKVVAEAMFWGCLPISTKVSCIPSMLGSGSRGILIDQDIEGAADQILNIMNNIEKYKEMSKSAMMWSRMFTTNRFEEEIVKMLKRT